MKKKTAARKTAKARAASTKDRFDGMGQMIRSLDTRNAPEPHPRKKRLEDVNQAAFRIVREATKD